jgi:Helix-turn-helix domain
MSNPALTFARAASVEFGLRGPDHSVLVALADRANDAGICWPGMKRLALDAGCCERAARKAVRRLEAFRLIATWQSLGRKSSTYALLMTAREAPSVADANPAPDAGIGPANPARDAGTPPANPARGAPKPSREEEPSREGSESVAPAARAREPLPVVEIFGREGGVAQPAEPPIAAPVASPPPPRTPDGPHPARAPVTGQVVAVRAAERPASGSGRKAPVPPDWIPSPEDRAYASNLGLDPDAMREGFVLWHQAKEVLVADPSAGFRLWCWREKRLGKSGKQTRAEKDASLNAAIDDMAQQLLARGFQGLRR